MTSSSACAAARRRGSRRGRRRRPTAAPSTRTAARRCARRGCGRSTRSPPRPREMRGSRPFRPPRSPPRAASRAGGCCPGRGRRGRPRGPRGNTTGRRGRAPSARAGTIDGWISSSMPAGRPERPRTTAPAHAGRVPSRPACGPTRSTEVVGQEHLLGEGSALRVAIEQGSRTRCSSTGRRGRARRRSRGSSRARARRVRGAQRRRGRRGPRCGACSSAPQQRRQATGERTVFFLDEIHRFNKAQQDALLPAVEEGLVTLIGATTENPYFEVNSALLSRTQVYELQRADRRRTSRAAAPRAGGDRRRGRRRRAGVPRRARGRRRADRARRARAGRADRTGAVTLESAEDALQRRAIQYDKQGRPPLRHDLGLDQGDARLGPRREPLLPRGDDRGAARTRASSPGGW